MVDHPARFCAVCGFPAHVTVDGRYFHPGRDAFDHVVVPVPAEELASHNAHCDFCYGTPCPWMIWSQSFTTGDGGARMRGNWACCEGCVTLVRQRRWTALARRVVNTGTVATYKELLDLYGRLAAHMGDVVPMDYRALHQSLSH